MDRKFRALGLLTIFALLSNTSSGDCVKANLLAGQQGVVRIDLERKYINHIDNLQLSEKTDINLIIEGPGVPQDSEEVLVDSDNMNYSQLREMQRRHTSRQMRQEQITSLAQQTDIELENNEMVATKQEGQESGKSHVHTAQLVSEVADASEDNRDDL